MQYWRIGVMVALAVGLACGSRSVVKITELEMGEPCTLRSKCRGTLVCGPSGTCEPAGIVAEGDPCLIDGDCMAKLRCSDQVCAPEGLRQDGALCSASSDCERELRCVVEGMSPVCRAQGHGYTEVPCTASQECLSGLVCDPMLGSCQQGSSAPVGESCEWNEQCAPDQGILCSKATGTCTGLGPDGEPTTAWTGVLCENPQAMDGDFRVLFEVNNTKAGDFFRLPFPNDAMLDLTVSLKDFPEPPAETTPVRLVQHYLEDIEAEQNGFGPNQSVFLRFSGPPKFCTGPCAEQQLPANHPCWTTCMGLGEKARSLYVADLSATGDAFQMGVEYRWTASTAVRPYICGPYVAVAPSPNTPWKPGHTYAVFVHADVRGYDLALGSDEEMKKDADFDAMLQTSSPSDATLAHAWTAYAPLRSWLLGAPVLPGDPSTDPHAGKTLTAAEIGGATVFTIRNPTSLVKALGDTIFAGAAADVSEVSVCDATTDPTCPDPATAGFAEVRGIIAMPNFQQGQLPYVETDGGIVVGVDGKAAIQGTLSVPFAMSVPVSAGSGASWPVVIYAHGTGGDHRSHIDNGLAGALARVAVTQPSPAQVGFVVLGIDQVAHGERKGTATLPADALFYNIANPRAAKGNMLQGAADQMSLLHAIANLSSAISGLAELNGATLDASQVAFVGHSQGAAMGTLAMARAPVIKTVVLSGAGGGLADLLALKTSPYDVLAMMRVLLADASLTRGDGSANVATRAVDFHPMVSLIQGYMEEADPINYAALVVSDPLAGGTRKHLLHLVGLNDTYTPNVTSVSLGKAMNLRYLDEEGTDILDSAWVIDDAPVRGNRGDRTQVGSLHRPRQGEDGHFVTLDAQGTAYKRLLQFLGSSVVDPANMPTVVEVD